MVFFSRKHLNTYEHEYRVVGRVDAPYTAVRAALTAATLGKVGIHIVKSTERLPP